MCFSRFASTLLRPRPLNVLVPPLALIERRLGGRWWNETRTTTDEHAETDHEHHPGRQDLSDGYGAAITRQYDVDLTGSDLEPARLFEMFVDDPDRFAPTEYAAFGHRPLRLGDEFTIRLAGPWNGPVKVAEVEPNRIRLVTLNGHMEAGRIDFRAIEGERPGFQIRSTARAGDPGFLHVHDHLRIGQWIQADMWARLLENLARAGGHTDPPRVEVVTTRHGSADRT